MRQGEEYGARDVVRGMGARSRRDGRVACRVRVVLADCEKVASFDSEELAVVLRHDSCRAHVAPPVNGHFVAAQIKCREEGNLTNKAAGPNIPHVLRGRPVFGVEEVGWREEHLELAVGHQIHLVAVAPLLEKRLHRRDQVRLHRSQHGVPEVLVFQQLKDR